MEIVGREETHRWQIWVDAKGKVVSFHPVDNGVPMEFCKRGYYLAYLLDLANRCYRFQ